MFHISESGENETVRALLADSRHIHRGWQEQDQQEYSGHTAAVSHGWHNRTLLVKRTHCLNWPIRKLKQNTKWYGDSGVQIWCRASKITRTLIRLGADFTRWDVGSSLRASYSSGRRGKQLLGREGMDSTMGNSKHTCTYRWIHLHVAYAIHLTYMSDVNKCSENIHNLTREGTHWLAIRVHETHAPSIILPHSSNHLFICNSRYSTQLTVTTMSGIRPFNLSWARTTGQYEETTLIW